MNSRFSRILVRGANWIGDAVMTTPALLRLRERFPDAHIALRTSEKLRDLWAGHPAINETISFAPGRNVLAVAGQLRAGKFDLALVLPNSPRSAMETWLAGIPRRIGYARPWRNFFLTQPVAARANAAKMRKLSVAEIRRLASGGANQRNTNALAGAPANVHQLNEYLHLVASLGANPEPLPPQLFVAPHEIEAAKKKFGLSEITQPIFGLNPGAEYGPAKRWPIERFVAAAQKVQQRNGCLWLMFGGKNDALIAQRIEYGLGGPPTVVNLAGRTSLRDLMALLKLCRVLLTNDSGPMHVAAAVGTPVVALFGSTSPELTGPGLPGDPGHHLIKSNVLCSPCFLRKCPIDFRCLKGIGAEPVVAAVLSTPGR